MSGSFDVDIVGLWWALMSLDFGGPFRLSPVVAISLASPVAEHFNVSLIFDVCYGRYTISVSPSLFTCATSRFESGGKNLTSVSMFNVDRHDGQLTKYVNRVLAQSLIPVMQIHNVCQSTIHTTINHDERRRKEMQVNKRYLVNCERLLLFN